MKKTNAKKAPVTAGILSTGTEILQGLYADTNAAWLSEQLTSLGLEVKYHMAAPDVEGGVAEALRFLKEHCRVVIMSGGLGPTEDDLTRGAVCEAFDKSLCEDPQAWEMIERRWALRGTPPPPSNRIQCMIPVGAKVLYNDWGTAPGFCLAHDSTWFAALPGPPREMKPMFEKYLKDDLRAQFGGGLLTRIRTLHTFGISESLLNDLLMEMFEEAKDDPRVNLAFLAGEAKVDIRITVRAEDEGDLSAKLSELERKVRNLLPPGAIYGADAETLEQISTVLLRNRGLKLATAESCTGGLIAKRITDLPGSSDVFLEGWVTYSNEAKHMRLGVREATLANHGAVSPQVAREMAAGALKKSGADVAVSVTGIAGPGGGTEDKPVGLVWYGLAWKSNVGEVQACGDDIAGLDGAQVTAVKTTFPLGRELTRAFASHKALDLVRAAAVGGWIYDSA